MKRSLLATLMVFASIGMYANTTIQSATSKVNVSVPVADMLPTPDFFYFIRPLGTPTPGARLATFLLSVPGPDQRDIVASVDWDFGDGTPPALDILSVNHSYVQPGTYDVTMTVQYVTGETFVIVKPVIITF
jgi:hypothetical protein